MKKRINRQLLTELGNKLYIRLKGSDYSLKLENKIFERIIKIKPNELSYRYR